jgi:hypothetical protein
METPAWATDHNLKACGQYYQGFVDDYKSVLSQHQIATVTSYGVRKSRACAVAQPNADKENEPEMEITDSAKIRIYWQKKEGCKTIQFENVPFSVAETKVLDCQFGPKYYKQKPVQGKRLWLQGTRKIGCKAHVEVKSFTLYPEFAITPAEREGLSKWKVRCLQEEKIRMIRDDIEANRVVRTTTKHFISLPSEDAHSGHPAGQAGVYAQKVHPAVSRKIVEMVEGGITGTNEMKHSLKHFVNTTLSRELGRKPQPGDRAFYPHSEDIRNHINKAKRALELSKYDQENLRLKIEEWKKQKPQLSFFFRPFSTSPPAEQAEIDENTCSGQEQTLLYVQQEDWQKELLTCYGNTVTLMDATYKTTKYSIPLFFVCVKTNVSYSVVAEFIIQSETAEFIHEALSILKAWNPTWEPQFYLTDYSDAEIAAITKAFPNTQVYLCEFHREQAWERWVKERKHGLSDTQAATLLDLLRDCANAPPNYDLPNKPPDHHFQHAVHQLKTADVWLKNRDVQQWLQNKWLSCPKMWARAYRDQTYHAAINTTNGVESQNKLLKYSYLPRRKNITLSQLAVVLYEEFVPESHQKYLYLNYQMSDTYRKYNDIVPDYLRGRPRHVIIHCLDRNSSSKKYTEDDILTKDVETGKFTIQGSGKVHSIDFGVASGSPTCTCADWLEWHIPCKHFFCIFRLVEGWGWNALPDAYQKSSCLCSDSKALSQQYLLQHTNGGTSEEVQTPLREELPNKKPSHVQSMRRVRQHIRIALKEIESLSFNMESAEDLHNLEVDLKSLQQKYGDSVPRDQGLFIRPKATCGAEKVLKLKQKYRRLTQRISHYKPLPTKQAGRPRQDASYRNRVGRKATNRRKELKHRHPTHSSLHGQPQATKVLTCTSKLFQCRLS